MDCHFLLILRKPAIHRQGIVLAVCLSIRVLIFRCDQKAHYIKSVAYSRWINKQTILKRGHKCKYTIMLPWVIVQWKSLSIDFSLSKAGKSNLQYLSKDGYLALDSILRPSSPKSLQKQVQALLLHAFYEASPLHQISSLRQFQQSTVPK